MILGHVIQLVRPQVRGLRHALQDGGCGWVHATIIPEF